jgi:S-methylmethionine-dependent homocysteine/selenocysteine methylase
MVSIFTVNYVDEAIGFASAAAKTGIPGVVSYTVETDGVMPDGTAIGEAIDRVDQEALEPPVYYMLNCAHPTHIIGALSDAADWRSRLRGFRANASRKSHAELDASDTLDAGDPKEFGDLFSSVRVAAPSITILGGCCGTDVRHIESIASEALS